MDRQEVKGTTQQEYGTRTDSAEGDRLHGARLDAVCKARQRGPNGLLRVTGHILWNGETYNSHFFITLLDVWEIRLLEPGHRRVKPVSVHHSQSAEGFACLSQPFSPGGDERLSLPFSSSLRRPVIWQEAPICLCSSTAASTANLILRASTRKCHLQEALFSSVSFTSNEDAAWQSTCLIGLFPISYISEHG